MHITLKEIQIFLLLSSTFIYPNIGAQGLIFDEKNFNKREKLKITRADTYPDSFSLKSFTPEIFEQQNASCVAYSIATAMTIAYAILNEITDKSVINAKMFSPHWLYYRNKELNDNNCNKGLNIEKAFKDLVKNGIPFMSSVEYPDYYPFSNIILCNKYPPNMKADLKEAFEHRVKSVYRITSFEGIKLAISKGMPVISALKLPLEFKSTNTAIWNTNNLQNIHSTFYHSCVLIGYNELNGGSFEIMNSWGKNWGNAGCMKISYKDFMNINLGAYCIKI